MTDITAPITINETKITTPITVQNTTVSGSIVSGQTIVSSTTSEYGLTTGIISGGLISVNANGTSLDITAGTSLYVDFSDAESPIVEILRWETQVIGTPLSASVSRVWIGVSRASSGIGTIVFQDEFSPLEMRTIAMLGRVWSNGSNVIEGFGQYSAPTYNYGMTLMDLLHTLGSINKKGNVFTANGTNRLLNKSAGESFRFAANFASQPTSPNIQTDPLMVGITAYHYHLYGAPATTLLSQIDTTHYDVAGVLTTIPTNKFTIQRVYYFPVSHVVDIVYGHAVYDTLDDAAAHVYTEDVSIDSANQKTLEGSILRGFVIFQEGTTNLSDVTRARLVENVGDGNSASTSVGPAGGAAGLNKEIQINIDGALGSSADLTFDKDLSTLKVGTENPVVLPDNPITASGSVDSYLQVNIQNKSNGISASADYIATADTGDDTQGYADLGICNSNYATPEWNVVGPIDSYIFADGGNIAVGSLTPGKKVKFFAAATNHEAHPSDVKLEIDSTGINITTGNKLKIGGVEYICEAASDSEEAVAFAAGAKIVIRTDLL